MIRAMSFLLLLPLLALCADEANQSKKDREAMQGEWACESLTRGGMTANDDDAQALFRTVKGDTYTVFRFRKKIGSGTFKVDASKNPKQIDMTPDGPKKVVISGIYKIDKDTVTICYAPPGEKRPTAFASKEGSADTLMVWKREKKE